MIRPAFLNTILDRFPYDRRFLTFLVVGSVNTAFGYAVLCFFLYLQLEIPLALLLSTIIGVLFNFKTTGGIVFANKDNRLLIRFVAVYAVLYVINLAALKALVAMQMSAYVASALLVLPMAILAFLLNRTFVFSEAK